VKAADVSNVENVRKKGPLSINAFFCRFLSLFVIQKESCRRSFYLRNDKIPPE
jgi:hypothetical protein